MRPIRALSSVAAGFSGLIFPRTARAFCGSKRVGIPTADDYANFAGGAHLQCIRSCSAPAGAAPLGVSRVFPVST